MAGRLTRQVDMTEGSLWDKILLFGIPVAATAILQQLYTTADVAVAGRLVGTNAEAGVGSNVYIISLLVSLFQGISLGANVTIATAIGAGEAEKAHRAVHTAVVLALVGGVAFAVATQPMVGPLLGVLSVPGEVLADATSYLRIYLLGLPVIFLYDFEAAILRSVGDTWTPLKALAVSSALNLALDLVVAGPLAAGARGLATTTVASNAVAVAILLAYLLRTPSDVRIVPRDLRLDPWAARRILSIGLPAGIQSALYSVANIVIQGAINSLGATVMAGSSASSSIESMSYYVINAFGQAATTFVGQNNGAHRQDRCARTLRLCLVEAYALCGTIIALIVIFGRGLVGVFNPNPAIVAQGYTRVRFVISSQLFSIAIDVFSGYLRGYGYSLWPAVWTFFSIVVIRLAYVFLLFPQNPTFPFLLAVYPITLGLNAAGLVVMWALVHRSLARQPQPRAKGV